MTIKRKLPHYKYVVSDAGGELTLAASKEEALKMAKEILDELADLAKHEGQWHHDVELVAIYELTHNAAPCDIVERPSEEELDDEGCDDEGEYWDDATYKCNYEVISVNEQK